MRASLQPLLEAHEPLDATEAEHKRRMLALLAASETPFSRSHLVPGHFTASAFVLSPDARSLLLILHGKLGLWLQPGGHIDPDDADVFAAARREVAEETGLVDVEAEPGLLDLDVHPIPPNPKKGEGPHEHFDVRILLRSRTLDVAPGSDAKDARWVPIDAVEDAGTDDSVLRAVRRVRMRLGA